MFFANSGSEANEAALKLTRLTGRTHVVAMEEAFHGRTMGSLALTSKEAYRTPFEPLPGHVTWVPFADAEALAAAVTDKTAAVVIEPLQGEAGVNVAPAEFLVAAREVTEQHGALLWFDEVQSGMGRTGTWLASQPSGVGADIVTLAKGLGGGLPVGACLGFGRAATLFEPGNHGTTFGGNPLSCAAALAVIDTIERDGLLARATEVGDRLRTELAVRRPGRRGPRDRRARGALAVRCARTRRGLGRAGGRVHRQRDRPRPGAARAPAGGHRRRRGGAAGRVARHPRRRLRSRR